MEREPHALRWLPPRRLEMACVERPGTVRNTRQKQAIREAFERAGRPLSTEEVHGEATRASRGLGMATVYRSIRSLLDDG
jgi:Fe2+ or Zn2+ uptake regulation protein